MEYQRKLNLGKQRCIISIAIREKYTPWICVVFVIYRRVNKFFTTFMKFNIYYNKLYNLSWKQSPSFSNILPSISQTSYRFRIDSLVFIRDEFIDLFSYSEFFFIRQDAFSYALSDLRLQFDEISGRSLSLSVRSPLNERLFYLHLSSRVGLCVRDKHSFVTR